YSKGKDFNINPPNRRFIDSNTVELLDEQDQGPNKRLFLDARMTAFDLGNFFNYFAAKADQASAKLNVLASEQDMILAVKTSYYAYLAAAQNLTVQEEAVKRAEEQLKLIQSRYDLGSAAKSDVLKQKVQYGNDQLALLSARNALTTARANLAYTIGVDPRRDWKFSTEYVKREYDGTLDEAISFGLSHRPSLLANEKDVAAASHGVRSALSKYLPTVGVFFDFTDFNGTQAFPVVFDYSFNNYTYGFNISLNIFDGFLRERQVTAAKVQRNTARARLADLRNQTISDIQTIYLDIEQLKKQQQVAGENVDAATEDLRITQERYNLGAASILDLLDAQVSLKEAQVARIRVDFDLNLKVAQLEQAMGKM
ncbi:MAG: TolC family protein, partial [Candidatus Zixiibacteriota bacterium]